MKTATRADRPNPPSAIHDPQSTGDAPRSAAELPEAPASRGETLTWRVHPARERIVAAALALAVIAAIGWLAADLMESLWWAALAIAFMLAALSRFFFPTRYVIDEEGVTAAGLLVRSRIRWSDVRRFVHDERGGHLSSRRRASMLDGFRGVHLLFHRNHNEVVGRIRSALDTRQLPEARE